MYNIQYIHSIILHSHVLYLVPQQVMSPDSRTVSQIPSFCNCNCILKGFHDFRDFHFLREFYSQYSHSKESYLASFLSITVDKSCRHRMHLLHENYFISSFLHSLVLSLFPISVDEIASLLPCFLASLLPCFLASLLPCHREKKSYVRTRSYYYIWHSNLCTTNGAEWELITPGKPHKSGISEAISPSWKA